MAEITGTSEIELDPATILSSPVLWVSWNSDIESSELIIID